MFVMGDRKAHFINDKMIQMKKMIAPFNTKSRNSLGESFNRFNHSITITLHSFLFNLFTFLCSYRYVINLLSIRSSVHNPPPRNPKSL